MLQFLIKSSKNDSVIYLRKIIKWNGVNLY